MSAALLKVYDLATQRAFYWCCPPCEDIAARQETVCGPYPAHGLYFAHVWTRGRGCDYIINTVTCLYKVISSLKTNCGISKLFTSLKVSRAESFGSRENKCVLVPGTEVQLTKIKSDAQHDKRSHLKSNFDRKCDHLNRKSNPLHHTSKFSGVVIRSSFLFWFFPPFRSFFIRWFLVFRQMSVNDRVQSTLWVLWTTSSQGDCEKPTGKHRSVGWISG